jgi:tripartite-type tricarboxylate transporter receptor subunit TctC
VKRLISTCLIAAAAAFPAVAQTDAAKPVRFIVPVPPGASADTMTRFFAESFQSVIGQPTVVENRPGGNLIIAVQNLLAAPADGSSVLLISPTTMVINPLYVKDLPYKPEQIRPLISLTRHVAAIVVAPNSKYKSLADLVAAAKAKPESVGMGTYSNHYRLGAVQFQRAAGVTFNQVPYKGAVQVNTDVAGGTLDAAVTDLAGALPMIQAGKLHVLAVTGSKRHSAMPNSPTISESGYPNYELMTFLGFGVDAKTPEATVKRLEAAMLKVIADPALRERIVKQSGAEIGGANATEFSEFIRREFTTYGELARSLGDKPQ